MGERSLFVTCCVLAALLAGCGGDAASSVEESATDGDARSTPTAPAAEPTAAQRPRPELAPNPWKEPESVAPHPRPSGHRVVVRDVRRGTGPAVHPWDTVKIDYIQAIYATGEKFVGLWGKGESPTAEMQLVPVEEFRGFVRGMDGMRVGGRRRIVSPPQLTGIETAHNIFRRHLYTDVVLRARVSRGQRPPDQERDLAPNPWPEPHGIRPHPNAHVERVVVRELARGRGPGLFANASMLVDFIEANYATGRTIYRAWGDEPYAPENLEAAAMMKGFHIGVRGMRAGGRRQIIVPPHLSDLDDPDRRGPTYRQPVYFDVVLRHLKNPVLVP